jgi:hypothetical protein
MQLYIDGCSYSSYYWPTWADFLVKQYPRKQAVNIAMSGSGNERIFFNLLQNSKHFIPGETKVFLQWSSYPRIDTWKSRLNWETPGNRYYVGDFVERNKDWWNDEYLQFKIFHYVNLAQKLLSDLGVEFYFMTMDNWYEHSTKIGVDWQEVIESPAMVLHNIDGYINKDEKYIYQSPWQDGKYPDGHPSVESHLKIAKFINNSFLHIDLDQDLISKYKHLHETLKLCDTLDDVHNAAGQSRLMSTKESAFMFHTKRLSTPFS